MDRNQIKSKARGIGSVETPKKAKSAPKAPKAPKTPKAPKVVPEPTPSDTEGEA